MKFAVVFIVWEIAASFIPLYATMDKMDNTRACNQKICKLKRERQKIQKRIDYLKKCKNPKAPLTPQFWRRYCQGRRRIEEKIKKLELLLSEKEKKLNTEIKKLKRGKITIRDIEITCFGFWNPLERFGPWNPFHLYTLPDMYVTLGENRQPIKPYVKNSEKLEYHDLNVEAGDHCTLHVYDKNMLWWFDYYMGDIFLESKKGVSGDSYEKTIIETSTKTKDLGFSYKVKYEVRY